jgi:hypothetical protein
MKTRLLVVAALFAALLAPLNLTAQDRPYTEGGVLMTTYIQTKPGMRNAYLNYVANTWIPMLEMAKKDGLVVSYRILSGERRTPQDWDLVLAVEVKNYGALDGYDAKIEGYAEKVTKANAEQRSEAAKKREEMRTIIGTKTQRILNFKGSTP